jgi:hypothetical protein
VEAVAVLIRSGAGPIGWLLVVIAAAAGTGCRVGAAQWGPFRGRIVDAETGAPISGAHFMVSWQRDNPNPVHWTQSFYDAQETVTDADGRFEIPRKRRLFTLLVGQPRFSAFAPGYFAESEGVVSGDGPLYVTETVLRMRRLKTVEDRCRWRPREPSDPRTRVPRFTRAVQRYNLGLDCAGLGGAQ